MFSICRSRSLSLNTHDELDRLLTATRGGVPTAMNYDYAGRKIDMSDPDMGYWQYGYNALGNLTSQTDARGCTLTLLYDSLNRLTGKHYRSDASCPASPALDVSYGYDATTNGNKGIGRRTSMNDSSGSTTWTYDLRGRVSNEVKTISGAPNPFTTQWTYTSADLPVQMTYPIDNEVITYGYNSDGSLNSVTSNTGGTYLAGTQYDEAGRIKQMDYGANILRKTFSYFPWNISIQGGLLNTAVTTRLSDQANRQSFDYEYDRNANISTIIDNQAGPQTQTFGYDSLNRLRNADATGGSNGLYSETYQYDAATGNLSMKGGVSYTYDPDHPHAVQSLSNGNSYGYDENGNMILRNVDNQVFELAYDAENRLVSVSPGSLGMNPPLPPGGGSGAALSLSKWVRADSLPRSGGGQGGGHLVSYNPQALLQSGFPSTPVLDHFNRTENPLSTNWEGSPGRRPPGQWQHRTGPERTECICVCH